MLFKTGKDFLEAPEKRLCLMGMSGVGKTHAANLLRGDDWYHYSVDYRIGTRYMGEYIVDDLKRAAMSIPLFGNLLQKDAVGVKLKIGFHNLGALSAYLGKVGDRKRNGLSVDEFMHRQEQHKIAEISALLDHKTFIRKATEIYHYPNFVCDTGGSLCSVVDPANPDDPVLTSLAENCVVVYLEEEPSRVDAMVTTFKQCPKPIYYSPDFFQRTWSEYLETHQLSEDSVDPDHFSVWAFERLIAFRLPRYAAIADLIGYRLPAPEVRAARNTEQLLAAVAGAIDARSRPT